MASVKVAVRVRPFNQREVEMEAGKIIAMEGKKTKIINTKIPENYTFEGGLGRERKKEFLFDYSYWSFDPKDKAFISQEQVFYDLGTDVIENAFEGYNACVFAYGQTGSGKTYTMMGTPDSIGLIPRICQNLFDRMNKYKNEGTTYKTEVSYMEIYNEKVKDLLRTQTKSDKLRVREHPQTGPYVQGLSCHPVLDYSDILQLMNKGNKSRTTASTFMNDASSRSHAILTITFVQAKFSHEMPSETVSKINLVDLAGSERADASGATGQRLKEGGHINKSLVTLGLVISSLADVQCAGMRRRPVYIPYRDSVLTWLLKDSLGGNSKTIMIATISPADVNYGETLSTLHYASRAKNIVNKPTINEDQNVKLIRELRAEIARLRSMLATNQNGNSSLMFELHANEEKVKVLTEEWAERWGETRNILQEQKSLALRKSGVGVVLDSANPHLVGMDNSLYSTGMTFYPLKEGDTYISGETALSMPDIVLTGDVTGSPCRISLNAGKATLHPSADIPCYVDRVLIDKQTELIHGCVIEIGINMFRYNDPSEAEKLRLYKTTEADLNLSRLSNLSWSTPDLVNLVKENYNIRQNLLDKGVSIQNLSQLTTHLESSNLNSLQRNPLNRRNRNKLKRRQLKYVSDRKGDSSSFCSEDSSPENTSKNEKLFQKNKNLSSDDLLSGNTTPESISSSFADEKDFIESINKQKAELSAKVKSLVNNIAFPENEMCHLSMQRSNSIPNKEHLYNDKVRRCKSTLAINTSLMDSAMNSSSSTESLTMGAELCKMRLCLEKLYNDLQRDSNCDIGERLSQVHALRNQVTMLESELHNLYGSQYIATSTPTSPLTFLLNQGPFHKKRNSSNRSKCSTPMRASRSSLHLDNATESILEEHTVAVSIPSFLERGAGSTFHYEYEINIMVGEEAWTVFRRYKRFRELHTYMKRKYGSNLVQSLRLPGRSILWMTDALAEARRQRLEIYLRELLAKCLTTKECHLFAYSDLLSKEMICEFIPFFRKGHFEVTKFETS